MKKIALAGLIVVVASLALAPQSDAAPRHHGRPVHARVIVGIGPSVWWGPYPYPYWYYPPPPYAVYAPPPVVIQEAPPVYVQQQAPTPAPSASEQFWYYCQSSKAYYPSVPSCAEPWVKVPPRP